MPACLLSLQTSVACGSELCLILAVQALTASIHVMQRSSGERFSSWATRRVLTCRQVSVPEPKAEIIEKGGPEPTTERLAFEEFMLNLRFSRALKLPALQGITCN